MPLEFSPGEERYQREPAHGETPERIFEKRCALTVLDRVVEIAGGVLQYGRLEHFERLKMFLLRQSDAPYAALAREMNTSEGALKVAIHRLRKRYRELLPGNRGYRRRSRGGGVRGAVSCGRAVEAVGFGPFVLDRLRRDRNLNETCCPAALETAAPIARVIVHGHV